MRYIVPLLLLFVTASADAGVYTSACSATSYTVEHNYIKTLLALTVEALNSPDFTDAELESVDYTLLPPTLKLKLRAATQIEIPREGRKKVWLASEVTVGLQETTIAWRLLRRHGPIVHASGTVVVVDQQETTRLKTKVNLKVQSGALRLFRRIVYRRTSRLASATACRVDLMLRKATEVWDKSLLEVAETLASQWL